MKNKHDAESGAAVEGAAPCSAGESCGACEVYRKSWLESDTELQRRRVALQELEQTLAHIQDQLDEMAFVLKETHQYKNLTPLEWAHRRDDALKKYAETRATAEPIYIQEAKAVRVTSHMSQKEMSAALAPLTPKIPLQQIASEPHVGVCSSCGRKTWDTNHIKMPFWKCGAETPSGAKCNGVWIPADTTPPNEQADRSQPR